MEELINIVKTPTTENTELKEINKLMGRTNKRLENLEREQNKNLQYLRRDTIEICGIPPVIPQNNLEEEVIKIFNAAKVTVHGKTLDYGDIQACHRIGKKKETTIYKFVNRKFAREAMYCGKNLKGCDLYHNNGKIFLNDSFCDEFRYLNFVIRKAKRNNKIFRWKVRNGINFIQIKDGDDFTEITHKSDLIQAIHAC